MNLQSAVCCCRHARVTSLLVVPHTVCCGIWPGMNVAGITSWCPLRQQSGAHCLLHALGSHKHLECPKSSQTVPTACHRHGCCSQGDHPGPRVWPAGGAGGGAGAEPGAHGAAGQQHCRRVHGGPPAGGDWRGHSRGLMQAHPEMGQGQRHNRGVYTSSLKTSSTCACAIKSLVGKSELTTTVCWRCTCPLLTSQC